VGPKGLEKLVPSVPEGRIKLLKCNDEGHLKTTLTVPTFIYMPVVSFL
jgi:hypothetical protein